MEKLARKSLESCKQSLVDDCDEAQKTRVLTGMQTEKCAHELSDGSRILLRTGLEAIQVTFWPRTCPHSFHALRLCGRADLKGY